MPRSAAVPTSEEEPDAPSVRAGGSAGAGNRILTGLLALAFLAKLGFDLWALDRGFEMGDEGLFLLNLNHPNDASPPFEFYRALGAFADGPWIGVVGARALRLAAELAGSAALVAGVFVWATRRVFGPGEVGAAAFASFCFLGTLLSVASRSFGYNDATNLLVYTALGCVFGLAALDSDASSRGRRTLAVLAAGLLCGIQLWVKFPAAFLWTSLLAATIGVGFVWLPMLERVRLVVLYGFAAAVGALLVVMVGGGFGPLEPRLEIASVLPGLTGYNPADILARYARFDFGTAVAAALFVAVFGVTAWLSARVADRSRDTALCIGLVLASLAVFPFVARTHPHFLHPTLVNLAALTVGLSSLLAALFAFERRRAEVIVPMILLIVAPWIQIVGTNVTLTMRLSSHLLPLVVLVALAAFDLAQREGCKRFLALVAVFALLLSGWVFVYHHGLTPYGLRAPIHKQTVEVETLGVRVDVGSASFLERTKQAFESAGFEPGDPIVALDYMPGLVYFLGGTSPGFNFYMFGSEALNCFNLNRAGFEKPPFLILGEEMSEAQRGCIEAFDYPGDFEMVRSMVFPYEAAYRNFGKRGMTDITIYGPSP